MYGLPVRSHPYFPHTHALQELFVTPNKGMPFSPAGLCTFYTKT